MSLEDTSLPKSKEQILMLFKNVIYFAPAFAEIYAHHVEKFQLSVETKTFMALNGLLDDEGKMSDACHQAIQHIRSNLTKKVAELTDGTEANYEVVADYFRKLRALKRDDHATFNEVAAYANGIKPDISKKAQSVLEERWIIPGQGGSLSEQWGKDSPSHECFFEVAKLSTCETLFSKVFNKGSAPNYDLVSPFKHPVSSYRLDEVPADKLKPASP